MNEPQWITDLEALHAKATRGVWRARPSYNGADVADVESEHGRAISDSDDPHDPVFQDHEGILGCADLADAEYVAALHNALPRLLALVREQAESTPHDALRRVLVRILNNAGSWDEVGYTIADEAIRRPITFRARLEGTYAGSFRADGPGGEATLDGLALIGEGGKEGRLSIEPIAHMLGQHVLKIDRTPELLWLPVTAHRNEMVDLWTIEVVPLVAWFRLSQRSDQDIIRLGGIDPDTGDVLLPDPADRCAMCSGYGRVPGYTPGASGAFPCPACGGSGKAH